MSQNSPSTADERSVRDIRGVLIQVADARLVLPNATIAEVLSYAAPEPFDNAPDWLLGRIRWHGWQVPLVAFSQLAGIARDKPGLGSKVVVLKALGGNPRAPYFAILTQGFPRLVTVADTGIALDDHQDDLPVAVQARVIHNDDVALLPDLQALEARIVDAIAEAA